MSNGLEPVERPDFFFARDIVKAWFYVLRLRSGNLYLGATKNLEERYKAHLAGKACRATKYDPPNKLVYSESFATFSGARKREAQIKRWSRAKTLFSCKTTTPSHKIQAIFTTFYRNIKLLHWSEPRQVTSMPNFRHLHFAACHIGPVKRKLDFFKMK